MLDKIFVFANGSKGVLTPLSASNGSCVCTGSDYGMKYENAYALEAWSATPFYIIFLVEISVISTESRPNTTCFGEPV